MKKAIRYVLYFLLFIVVIFVAFVARLLYQANYFSTLSMVSLGKEKRLQSPTAGTEDLAIDYETGIVYVSADDRRYNRNNPQSKKNGAIYALDLDHKELKWTLLSENFKGEFHPHGISFYKDKDGKKYLFVINHTQQAHTVEIFSIEETLLQHQETIKDDKNLVNSPNDLYVVGKKQFYISNDHGFTDSFWRTLEDYLQLGYSYVCFYDGKSYEKVAENIQYANGISGTADGKQLLVASTTGKCVRLYDRNLETNALSETQKIYLNTGVDNIERDKSGHFWIGCHPKMLAFAAHANDDKKKSPSQVIKLSYQNGQYLPETYYQNDGQNFSGSSVAVYYENQWLLGAVFEPYVLRIQK